MSLHPTPLLIVAAVMVASLAGCLEDSWDNEFVTEDIDSERPPVNRSEDNALHSDSPGQQGAPATSTSEGDGPTPDSSSLVQPWKTWPEERDQRRPFGALAQFHLQGNVTEFDAATLAITGNMMLTPDDLFRSNTRFVYFQDAILENGTIGVLVVQGDAVNITGVSANISAHRIAVGDSVSWQFATDFHNRPPTLNISTEWPAANRSSRFAVHANLPLHEATVSGFERGLMVTETAAFPINETIRISAGGLWLDGNSWGRAEQAEAHVKTLHIGGNVTGFVDVEGFGNHTNVLAIFGEEGRLLLWPHNVSTTTPVRVTQVALTDRLLLPAIVDAIQPSQRVEIMQNETKWIKVHVREAGFTGAAALDNISITGTGASAVSFPLKRPPSEVEKMFNILDDLASAGLAGVIALPFAAIAFGIFAPFLGFVEALSCLFSTCYHHYPYPAWMQPGHVGVVYYPVKADLPPGDYNATITIEGLNYPDVQLDLDFTVTAPEQS